MTYTVIYRTGGTANGAWHRTLETFATRTAAAAFAATIERQGYPTLVHQTALLEAVGLPTENE